MDLLAFIMWLIAWLPVLSDIIIDSFVIDYYQWSVFSSLFRDYGNPLI